MAGRMRFFAAVLAAALAAVTLATAAPVSAAPYEKAPAPYTMAPSISVSTNSPCTSTAITVTGMDFVPGSTVTLTLQGVPGILGTVVVDANGGFTTTVTLPEVVGTFQLVATGPSTATNPNTAQTTLNILDCAVATPPASPAAPPAAPSISAPVVPVTG